MTVNQSLEAKERWEICRKLADKLDCGKTHVHDKLFRRMKEEGLIDPVLDNMVEAIDKVKGWPEFSQVRPVMFDSEGDMSNIAPPTSNGGKKSKATQAMERLKLAMWFVEKIGGPEKARKAIDVVEQMADQLAD